MNENPINITSKRFCHICNVAKQYHRGGISMSEALEQSQREGVFAKMKNLFNDNATIQNKKTCIKNQFQEVFHREEINFAIENILYPLNNINDENQTINYHQVFLAGHCENSQYKLSISSLEYDNNTHKVKINLHLLNKSNGKFEIFDIESQTPLSNNDIVTEYAIFKNKQFGEPISDEIRNSPETLETARNRIEQHDQQEQCSQYEGISFSGGGAKGVGYPAILESLGIRRLHNIQYVAGTSAGAITAALVATGISHYELQEFIINTELEITQEQLRQLIKKKLYETINKRLSELQCQPNFIPDNEQLKLIQYYNDIRDIKEVTFSDLEQLRLAFPSLNFKRVYLSTTLKYVKQKDIKLSYKTTPNMPISLATTASAALPPIYDPIEITEYLKPDYKKWLNLEAQKIFVYDGGITNNTPENYLTIAGCPHDKILNLAFADNVYKPEQEMTMAQKFIEKFIGCSTYCFGWADMLKIQNAKHHLTFIIKTGNISATSFKEASKKFMILKSQIEKDFITHEISMQRPSTINNYRNYRIQHNILKFIIFPKYYHGTEREKQTLQSTFEDGKSVFQHLCMSITNKEFYHIYNSIKSDLEPDKALIEEILNDDYDHN